MVHDPDLLARLDAFAPEVFGGEVFRATRASLDPLTPSLAGGRWSRKDDAPTLYTSLNRDGSIAEIAFHLAQMNPLPRKPVVVNRLAVVARRTLRLLRADLVDLGVDASRYDDIGYSRTQEIGAATAFLECDGLLVPSARWDCNNLVLFPLNQDFGDKLELTDSQVVDWVAWADAHKVALGR